MNYLRMCWYYLFDYDVEKDGGLYKLTGWQHIKATDGPIHTVWCWWGSIRYHWIVLGIICRRNGHMRRSELVAPRCTVWTCGRCGTYFGRSVNKENA